VYVLVLLRDAEKAGDEAPHAETHERFIDGLIERHAVLHGGSFAPALGDVGAAYVLRCGGLEEAEAIAAEDPLVAHGVVHAECVEWELVGIDSNTIDRERPKQRSRNGRGSTP
jgi:uncharacterized protein YciI